MSIRTGQLNIVRLIAEAERQLLQEIEAASNRRAIQAFLVNPKSGFAVMPTEAATAAEREPAAVN